MYAFVFSVCVCFLGSEPMTLGVASAPLYQLSYRNAFINQIYFCVHKICPQYGAHENS